MLHFLRHCLESPASKGPLRCHDGQPGAKFDTMGDLDLTPAAVDLIERDPASGTAIRRHAIGDWGDVTPGAWVENDRALTTGRRILSVYHTALSERFYIVTRGDRARTKVLLPHEYHSRWRRFLLGLAE